MFRDLKLGGYNLEVTQVSDRRLIATIILITLSYLMSILSGQFIKKLLAISMIASWRSRYNGGNPRNALHRF